MRSRLFCNILRFASICVSFFVLRLLYNIGFAGYVAVSFACIAWACSEVIECSLPEDAKMDISTVSTFELVNELSLREGVEKTVAEPYQDVQVKVNGPAVVLVVID